jgi:hypothetical protein
MLEAGRRAVSYLLLLTICARSSTHRPRYGPDTTRLLSFPEQEDVEGGKELPTRLVMLCSETSSGLDGSR